jgi:hypothetical protein
VPDPPSALEPVAELAPFHATRASWHRLAEHVLAPARYRATGRIGLRATPGGVGTPAFPSPTGGEEQVRIAGAELVFARDGGTRAAPITTVGEAAAIAGIAPGAPVEVYPPSTPLEPDAPLTVDPVAAALLGAWYAFADAALGRLRATVPADDAPAIVQLWPEHFDLATDLGVEAHGARGTFGASPGDAAHAEPYLYVTHWADTPDDPYWSERAFAGASLTYAELCVSVDPIDRALSFFRRGRDLLAAATRG